MKATLVFAGLLAAAAPIRAYIQADPSAVQVQVSTGGSHTGSIRLKNMTDKALDVSGKVMDWKYEKPNGVKEFLPAGTTKHSAASWMTLTPDRLTLEPGKTTEVRYTLSVPANAEGGRYAAVLFSAFVPQVQQKARVVVNVALQVATLFLMEVENTQKVRGRITGLKVVNPRAKRPLEVRASFRNEGNVRLDAKGRLSILNAKGNAVGWTKFSDLKTLPGDEWPATATWSGGLAPGSYRLVATFELAPGHILVEEQDLRIE
jgi:hypothetical protein